MNTKSFTLIELLVVIVIIGILAGAIMISTSSSISKASLAKAQAFSKTVQNELLLNLVSEWTFDEGSGVIDSNATAFDLKDVWSNNDGTLTGSLILRDGDNCIFGKCLESDGLTANYFNVGQDSYTNDLAIQGNITIEVWFNVQAVISGSCLVSQKVADGTVTHGRGITLNSDNLIHIWTRDATHVWREVSTPFEYNIWNHAVLIQNGNAITGYLNGKALTTFNMTGNMGGFYYGYFRVGNYTHSSYLYDGFIDDVRVYNTSLSSADIRKNYGLGLNSLLSKGSISKEEYNKRIEKLGNNF